MTRRKASIGTFTPNQGEPIHGWYPYVEGYASKLVERELDGLDDDAVDSVYDPFAGTGTTLVVASQRGIPSYYSETNPFMRFVIDTKVNATRHASDNRVILDQLQSLDQVVEAMPENVDGEPSWDGFERYFVPDRLQEVLSIKSMIANELQGVSQDLAMLALSSILVESSMMMRRGDLRFARASELAKRTAAVRQLFCNKIRAIVHDIERYGHTLLAPTSCVSQDSRELPRDFKVDCIITSPPYLNGTNYIRNTKLELKLNDLIGSEDDLPSLHARGIVAGINNVSKRIGAFDLLPEVERYYEALKPVAYDKRIPVMIACYFRDMDYVLQRIAECLNDNGVFVMDIGDSQFAGIHIPTHDILSQLAKKHGLLEERNETLRSRRSKNGMILTQQLIRYRLG